jgi:hypothetical protein
MAETLAPHSNPTGDSTSAADPVSKHHPAVLDQAEKAFNEFMGLMNDEYSPLASSLHETGKKLYEQVSHHWSADKHHVGLHQWDAADVATDLLRLQSEQEPRWAKLQQESQELRDKVDAAYKKLQDAEAAVIAACAYKGSSHAPRGGFVTSEVDLIRHYHDKKLRHNMQEAKNKHDEVCGVPNGLLTRIDAIHKRVLSETEALIDRTAKKEHGIQRFL